MTDHKAFFDEWVARTFAADTPWADLYPTPLTALVELRAAAILAGIPQTDLRHAVGDLLAVLTAVMRNAPTPDVRSRHPAPDRTDARDPVLALELALSYGDSPRDAVGSEHRLTACLMLQYLARRGYGRRSIELDARQTSNTGRSEQGERVH